MWRNSTLGGVISERRWLVVAAVVLVAAAVGLSGAVRAPAASPCATPEVLVGSNFEIDTDANLKVNGAAGSDCIDWLAGGTGSALRSGVLRTNDIPAGPADDSFGQGSQENDAVPTIIA